MFPRIPDLRREWRPMLRLAIPVVTAELGWMAMGVVDTVMVGRLGPEAIGAVSIGRSLLMFVAVFGIGLLLGLDTVVSGAFGAGRREECDRWLVQGLYLCLMIGPPLILCVRLLALLLESGGIDPTVLGLVSPYVAAVSWAALPIFFYTALRRYLQAMNLVRPVMLALISANLVNVTFNGLLIFGLLGFPRMGVAGAGWATCIASTYMALFLAAAALLRRRAGHGRLWRSFGRPESARLRRLLTLGIPAALQLLLEVGVFALATVLAGRLQPFWLAAHQIALTAASVTYMVPLGFSSAAAVRVGQALGRNDRAGAARAGWAALALGGGFMVVAALVFVSVPAQIVRIFSPDPQVIKAGVTLLFIAAVFQFFDGIQVVATGALRGAGDTRTAMVFSLVGYWLLGLPVGVYLCFFAGWAATGLWTGFSIGLILAGLTLVTVWARRTRDWALPAG